MNRPFQELIDRATERLVAEFRPDEVWLFGSHAWGTPREDSDVDLMVIVPESDERATRRMQRAITDCLNRETKRIDGWIAATVTSWIKVRTAGDHGGSNE